MTHNTLTAIIAIALLAFLAASIVLGWGAVWSWGAALIFITWLGGRA